MPASFSSGDYTSLTCLHEIIHDVNDRSPIIVDKEDLFLGLAYEVCKAFERQRGVILPPLHFPGAGVRYGAQILLLVLLLQQSLLRQSLAYLSHTAKTQAIIYALQTIIEEGLGQDFGGQADRMISL